MAALLARVPETLRVQGVSPLLAAELVSATGTSMTFLALPWFVLVTTGSAASMTLVMAAAAAGPAICGIPGGWIASRTGVRRWMLGSNLIRAALIALVPALQAGGLLSLAALLPIVFVVEGMGPAYAAAQAAVLPELVGEDPRSIGRATALVQAATRATVFLGPALAGLLILQLGAANVLWVDAASYAIAWLLTLAIPARASSPQPPGTERLFTGLRFVRSDVFLRRLMVAVSLFEAGYAAVLVSLPILVVNRFGDDPTIAGGLIASFGMGALIGSLIAYILVNRLPAVRLGTGAAVVQALPLWVLVADTPPVVAGLALLLSGLAAPIANAPLMSLATLRIPAALRASTISAMNTIWLAGAPVAIAISGFLVVNVGLSPTLAVWAVVVTGGALLLFRLPRDGPHDLGRAEA